MIKQAFVISVHLRCLLLSFLLSVIFSPEKDLESKGEQLITHPRSVVQKPDSLPAVSDGGVTRTAKYPLKLSFMGQQKRPEPGH